MASEKAQNAAEGLRESLWKVKTPPGTSELEAMGLMELEHLPKNNRVRAAAK